MGIELERAIVDFIHSNHVKKTFGNPMFVAVIIAIIVMLIMYFVVRDKVEVEDDSPKSFIMLAFTTGIYVLVSSMGVMFIHNKVMQGSYEKEYENYALEETIAATVGSMESNPMAVTNSSVLGDAKLKPTYKDDLRRKHAVNLNRFLRRGGKGKRRPKKAKLPGVHPLKETENPKNESANSEEDPVLEEAKEVDISEESYEEDDDKK